MLALVVALSIAGLAVGPFLVALGRRGALPASALDGLTLGLVPALVLSRHLPHAVEEIGAQAVLWAALGYAALWLTEHRRRGAGEAAGREVAFSALAAHGLLDGAALALASAEGDATGWLFAVAVVVHRLPEGLSLAARFLPAWGWRQLAARLGLLGALTALGALLGQRLLEDLPHDVFEVFIAFGLGVLLRIVVHAHEPPPRSRAARAASAAAFVAGLGVALALPSPESFFTRAHPRELSIAESLGPLFVETAPSLLAGLAAAGLLRAFLPRRAIGWLRGGSTLSQAARGVVFAQPLPRRSRGVLPLLGRPLRAGAPLAAVVALAVAAPALDVGGALLSLRLLGSPLAAMRVAGGALVAVAVAVLVARVAGAPDAAAASAVGAPGAAPDAAAAPRARLREAVAEAIGPALDHVAAWYLVGLVLAAVVEATIAPAAASALGAPVDVLVSAIVAVPVHVCAPGAAPLAAVMIHKGFTVGAALAFLVVGPAGNLAVLAGLRRALGARVAAAFALSSVAFGIALGLIANALVPGAAVPELHGLLAREHAPLEWLCAAALGALLLSSLARLGPRAWFGNMGDHGEDPAAPREHGPHEHGLHGLGAHERGAHGRRCVTHGAPV
ncbi:permease [Sorangium sp. So ce1036]|uniref:permease n=1 Tax=Sorangium sp. So ce1036 TaxID=3133328 RepID=UPI003EFC1BC0